MTSLKPADAADMGSNLGQCKVVGRAEQVAHEQLLLSNGHPG